MKVANEKLQKGINLHETKYLNQHSVEVAFPLATGVPFTYSYKEPTLMFVDVQAKGQLQEQKNNSGVNTSIPYTASMNGDFKIT